MFECGERVLYGIHGVCEIIAVETRKISGKSAEYYVLQPLEHSDSKYYVPTQNQIAVAKMRPILTTQELTTILHAPEIQNSAWIHDENQRKQLYTSLITSGDRRALVQMVHSIHKHKALLSDSGKRLHSCDENFLRDAEKLLASEFSLVLNIDYSNVGNYVKSIIEKEL